MSDLILNTIKNSIGVLEDNLAFDLEILLALNSAKAALVQLGLEELNINIKEDTMWPEFSNETIKSLAKQYLIGKTKQIFDPTASETISKSLSAALIELEGRLAHEIQEVSNG